MPITSKIKGYPFEVVISKGKIKGAILCDQIRFFDWRARNASFIEKVSGVLLEEIVGKFKVLLPK